MTLTVSNSERAEIAIFAAENGLDAKSLELMFLGTVERVEAAMAKGEPLSQELIVAALTHYHHSFKKYCNDVLENKNGELDKLAADVYAGIKKTL